MSIWNDCVQSCLSDLITSAKVQQEEKDHTCSNPDICCNMYKKLLRKMCVCVWFLTLIVPTWSFLPFFSLVSFK